MKMLKNNKLEIDWFFLISGMGVFIVGTLFAKNKLSSWDLLSFFAALTFFVSIYLLQRIAHSLSNPTVVENTRISTGKKNIKAIQYIPALFLLALIFTCLYFLLKQQVLIGINLIWLSLISILTFVQTSQALHNLLKPVEWLLKSLIISPLMLLLGISVQAIPVEGLHYLLALPIFFLSSASFVTFEFPKFDNAPNENKNGLIARTGLDQTLQLHRILVLMAYACLLAYLYFSGTFRTHWTLILVAGISFFQMVLLNRIVLGMKPNFTLIKATAVMQVISFIYLLIIKFVF